jgi:hypothetical protein
MLGVCPKSEPFGSGMKHNSDLVQGKNCSRVFLKRNKVSMKNNFTLLLKSYRKALKDI